jgi:pSer/pThr/pTyr-binding forkhead associated (FHA) protein
MIKCPNCQTANLDASRFCDECGSRLVQPTVQAKTADYVPPEVGQKPPAFVDVNAIDVAPVESLGETARSQETSDDAAKPAHATLIIERGGAVGTEFALRGDAATIGRWDADNGIFPDIDLDAHDEDAKVSRRHARISRNNGSYFIEDLGSTNGTYINRGRRLLPGNIQILKDGDEVIVGKTFLRFLVNH